MKQDQSVLAEEANRSVGHLRLERTHQYLGFVWAGSPLRLSFRIVSPYHTKILRLP
jgi:hypothetical protein